MSCQRNAAALLWSAYSERLKTFITHSWASAPCAFFLTLQVRCSLRSCPSAGLPSRMHRPAAEKMTLCAVISIPSNAPLRNRTFSSSVRYMHHRVERKFAKRFFRLVNTLPWVHFRRSCASDTCSILIVNEDLLHSRESLNQSQQWIH